MGSDIETETRLGEIDEIEKASAKIQSVSTVLSKVFLFLFLVACLLSLLMIALMIGYGIEEYASGRQLPFLTSAVKMSLELAMTLFVLWVPKTMFHDMSQGISPFTIVQARRLKIASVLFTLHAIFSLIVSPVVLSAANLKGASIGFAVGIAPAEVSSSLIPINVGDIVLAIVLFCAALIVEYGSLLQKLSDDTL